MSLNIGLYEVNFSGVICPDITQPRILSLAATPILQLTVRSKPQSRLSAHLGRVIWNVDRF